MPNNRFLAWISLAAILFYGYQAWMHDYPPPGAPGAVTQSKPGTAAAPAGLGDTVPEAASSAAPPATSPTPATSAAPPSTAPAPAGAEPLATPPATAAAAPLATDTAGAPQLLHVVTDVLAMDINLKGGELDQADLLKYPLRKDAPNIPVRLLSRDPASEYLLQTGLSGAAGEAAPTHLAMWTAADKSYVLGASANEVRVPLTWTDGAGLTVTKTFVFTRGQYSIDLIYDVQNTGAAARRLVSYSQFKRHWEHTSRSYFDVETYSFKGPGVDNGVKYQDLNVESDSDNKFSETITNGWIAILQHQFVSAIVPSAGQPYEVKLQVRDNKYLLSATGPSVEIAAGGKAQFHEKLFVGPKLQAQLAATSPRLPLTVDFGTFLHVLAQPLFTGLNWVHGIIGNWGWSIIVVTAIIKLIFYPLSQASGRSMAKMRTVAPRMKQIQETFKDDREKLGRAMMELYKKEKINPLAGCLPMLVQIPFFISFYRVLLESVEMRQAPFLLWVNDLSSRDPFFVLPLLMGGAMYAQFKLNPAPADPMQAKIMQFMPLIMTGMMAWFPSGLVLYWLTNTLLTIAQQWRVNQVVEAEAAKLRN